MFALNHPYFTFIRFMDFHLQEDSLDKQYLNITR